MTGHNEALESRLQRGLSIFARMSFSMLAERSVTVRFVKQRRRHDRSNWPYRGPFVKLL